jgi:hypothetical protein
MAIYIAPPFGPPAELLLITEPSLILVVAYAFGGLPVSPKKIAFGAF